MNFGGSGDVSISVGGDLNPLEQALQQIPVLARQAGEAAAQALSAATSSGSGAAGAFDAAATATRNLSDAMNVAVGAAVDLDKELQNKQVDAGGAAAAFGDLGKQLSDAGAAMVLIGGALSVVSAGLVELGESSLMAAGKMEQQRVAMVNLTHSASETDTLIRGLVDFAVKTPFEIPGVVEMGQKLVAMGTATKDVIPLLTTLGDTASGSGKGFAGLNVLVNDFGKMAQLGTVHMRELNTLAYQGVPAIQALADAFGVSTNRMRQMIEQNLVSAADAMPILTKAMNDKFGGMMAAQSQTFLGMWSNFKDSITKTLIAIGDAIMPAFKSILTAIQPLLDTIQQMAKWFSELPAPVQSAAVALGLFVIALGPVVLGIGALVFTVGQVIIAAQTLAPIIGVELPAAFTRGTIATVANTEALVANAAAAQAAGAASATAVVEGAGAASIALGALKAAAGLAGIALAAVATAFVAGKLIASILETIPYVKTLQTAWADQAAAENGLYATAMSQGSIAYFKGLGESAKGSTVGLDLAATSLKRLQAAQDDANQALKVAKQTMDAAAAAQDGSAKSAAVYARAVEEYNTALKKANPMVGDSAKAFDAQALAAQTTGAEMLKYIKLWSTIPWDVWGGDVAAASTAITEQGFSIDKTIEKLKKMAAALEGGASTSEALKAQRDEILANINQLEGMKAAIDGLNTVTKGWHSTIENGVTVWREYSDSAKGADAAHQGFTTTVVNGVTVIKGAKDASFDLDAALNKLAGSTRAAGEAMIYANGQWQTATEYMKQLSAATGSAGAAEEEFASKTEVTSNRVVSAHGKAAKAVQAATDLMSESFMQGMAGMTASGEQYIAMLAQLGAPDGMLAQTARAFGYLEIGIRQYVNEAQALKMSLSPQQDALTKFFFGGSTGDLISSLKAFSDALHPTSKAVADLGTASTQTATDIPKVFQPLTDAVGGTVKVFQPLTYSANAAAQALGAVGDAASGTATGMKTFQDLLGDSNTQIKGTADMFRDFPEEMGKAKGQTLQNLVNLGVNFYDAVTATNAFTDAAVDASKMIRSASATVAGDAANQTDFAKYVLAMGQKDMADYLADPMSKRDMSATSKSGVDPATQTPFAQAMLAAAQADMAAFLASGTNAPRAGSSMVANPNSMYSGGRKTLGDISAPVGLMPQSNGGVTINVIQPTVMDMGMVNSLTNKVATQMTNILRQNAGLKV